MKLKRVGQRLGRVGGLGKLRSHTPKVRALPVSVLPEVTAIANLEEPAVLDMRRRLGADDPETDRLIARVLRLEKRLPESASLPEIVAYDWLRRKGVQFDYQGEAFGGRMMRGGQVPDFVIGQGGGVLCWRIQGEYWHSKPGDREKDLVQKIALLATRIDGRPVWAVVDIWEDDIYRDREKAFRLGLAGIGLRE